jgi:GT2 family glycosyltransferase
MKKILLICVNYHDSAGCVALVQGWLDLLGQGSAWQLTVVVADNSAANTPPGFAAQLQALTLGAQSALDLPPQAAPQLHHLDTGGNLGYFGAVARAHAYACDHTPMQADWVLVSNSDIRMTDPGFALKLCAQRADVVAPNILRQINHGLRSFWLPENPLLQQRPDQRWLAFSLFLCRYYPLYAVYDRLHHIKQWLRVPSYQPSMPIYAPFGALMAFRNSYFDAGGGFNHPGFLFAEEFFVAEECDRLGLRIDYAAKMGAWHLGSGSMKTIATRQQWRWGRDSLRAIAVRYFAQPEQARKS